METNNLKIRITFTEDVLGTASKNPDIHRQFIASKAPNALSMEEEVEAIGAEAMMEKSMTGFPRTDEGHPFLYDYQVKGFFKDTCAALRKVPGSKCSKVKAYKKEIDGLLFVYPRKIVMNMSGDMTICERPLRAQTMQGDRVALSSSEAAPSGTYIDLEIECLTRDMHELAIECLDNGKRRGLGQWRNSGKGRFTYEVIK